MNNPRCSVDYGWSPLPSLSRRWSLARGRALTGGDCTGLVSGRSHPPCAPSRWWSEESYPGDQCSMSLCSQTGGAPSIQDYVRLVWATPQVSSRAQNKPPGAQEQVSLSSLLEPKGWKQSRFWAPFGQLGLPWAPEPRRGEFQV